MYGQVHEVAVILDRYQSATAVAQTLQQQLPELTVSSWQQVEEEFYKSMQSDKQGNHATMAIILFIVFIGVLNTVLMTVLERTREFGVLKAIGSQPSTVLLLVSLETCLLAMKSIVAAFFITLPLISILGSDFLTFKFTLASALPPNKSRVMGVTATTP